MSTRFSIADGLAVMALLLADPTRRWHEMSRSQRVTLAGIRTVHTLIFAVELACIGWLVRTGAAGRRDRTVALAAGLVAAEVVVFIGNDGVCPLTPLAEGLGAEQGSVSDIFLPDALARTLPLWSTALLVLAAALHARSAWRARAESVMAGVERAGDEALEQPL